MPSTLTVWSNTAIFQGMGGSDRLTTLLPVPGPPLRVVRLLGGGATSRVLLAERGAGGPGEGGPGDKVSVVVKLGRDMGQRPRFADEAERLCLVDSPWVAPLLD